jgi:HSP20 family molecular chaperone IbpA
MKKIGIVLSAAMFLFAVPSIAFANPVVSVTKGTAYSVTEVDEETFTVDLPVAGFAKSALEATVKGNVLTIKGTPPKSDSKVVYRGFQPKAFVKNITLKKGTKISRVTVNSGVLTVELSVELPAEQKTRKVTIN